eukprot:CAMPEP_0117020020 /NCGR_PEP_ID=MMETSP0472-20121206/15272_1 /TAXON_ID=693140 ORGANISM="Tiarina fusus, Strain LIS" /NCGR_SAMPLE_ID=MMETSP0472 /ASSEMBLY_ACC=CAM_ASM_000603 /LENGTH=223 /DNA_ID=CAMNT_0004725115 /DNA_START=146 /DNA_END=817 /DNA_ORIENTATION=-
MAFVLGGMGNFWCETVEFALPNGDMTLYANAWSYRTIAVAEFNDDYYVFNVCKTYRAIDIDFGFEYTVDAKTSTVRAFAIITVVVGALAICIAYMLPCTRNLNPAMWKMMGLLLIATTFFQGMTMLVLRSSICLDHPLIQFLDEEFPRVGERFPESCQLSSGFRQIIASVVLWFSAGAMTLVLSPPDGSLLSPVNMSPGGGGDTGYDENVETAPEVAAEKESP